MKIFKFGHNQEKKDFQNLALRVDDLLESARKLYTQSEEIKKVVSHEKNAVEKSSAAAHQIASMVATTAAAAQELLQAANSSNQNVDQAVTALESLSGSINVVNESSNRLQLSVTNGLKEISSVTKTMEEIREKAKVINDIVFQTKLLSFNASVEAARAGEHGKGFAVVAEEMGNLARLSGAAAKEIEDILNSSVERTNSQIQNVTSELESVASETVSAINEVSAKTQEISGTFTQLTENSRNTESQSQEISKATKEQDIGVNEISKALQELERSSQQLDSMAISSNTHSAELANQVEYIFDTFKQLANRLGYAIKPIEKKFDFNAAIAAHIDWKMKLSKYLVHPDGSLDHSKVCKDNNCALGKWIYGDGQYYRDLDSNKYEQLKTSHAEFHKIAGDIIRHINLKNTQEAEILLSAEGPYLKVSAKTVELIKQLKATVEQAELEKSA